MIASANTKPTSTATLALGWIAVGAPLLRGVVVTLTKAFALFR